MHVSADVLLQTLLEYLCTVQHGGSPFESSVNPQSQVDASHWGISTQRCAELRTAWQRAFCGSDWLDGLELGCGDASHCCLLCAAGSQSWFGRSSIATSPTAANPAPYTVQQTSAAPDKAIIMQRQTRQSSRSIRSSYRAARCCTQKHHLHEAPRLMS
jgi:hypothetical protein